MEEWAGQRTAPATPVVAVLGAGSGGGEDDDKEGGVGVAGEGTERRKRGGMEMRGGGADPPVVTRVLPPGLEVRH